MNGYARLTAMVAVALGPLLLAISPEPSSQAPSQRVSRAELVEAMKLVAEREPRFDITATTNGARFQGDVIQHLADRARERDPEGPPLFIDHEDSFEAYLQVARLMREQAPVFVRKAHEHRQAQLIEYRQDAVVASVDVGPKPQRALAVKAFWPDTPGLPRSFSYEDTYSVPNLRVTNQRVVTYKLVKFSGFTLYDQVSGVSGKPTSGFLGALFALLGDGRVLQSRSAITTDGLQIVLTHAKWAFIHKHPIVTIQKNGRAEETLDLTRGDIRQIEATLKQEIRIRYRQE
jgi:hypothetical protein